MKKTSQDKQESALQSEQESITSEITEEDIIVGDNVYNYKIETTLKEAYRQTTEDDTEDRVGIFTLFEFSRPVFAKKSTLTEKINSIYDKLENDYKERMTGLAEDGTLVDISDIHDDSKLFRFTELCETVYEKNGIISFKLVSDWWMGGVHNSWIIGNIFDFNLGRELKINDIFQGDESKIIIALENAFYEWFKRDIGIPDLTMEDVKREFLHIINIEEVTKQSNLNANFYLTNTGVHIYYNSDIGLRNGANILIPWSGTELIRSIYK